MAVPPSEPRAPNATLERARALASRRGDHAVHLADVLGALAAEAGVIAFLQRCGYPADVLARCADALASVDDGDVEDGFSDGVHALLGVQPSEAMDFGVSGDPVHLLLAAARSPQQPGLAIRAAGLDPAHMIDVLCWPGGVPAGTPQDEDGTCELVLLNDDFTTKDFVVRTLRTVLELDDSTAVEHMHTVHDQGEAVILVTSTARAELVRRMIHQHAREHGFPLSAQVRPARPR